MWPSCFGLILQICHFFNWLSANAWYESYAGHFFFILINFRTCSNYGTCDSITCHFLDVNFFNTKLLEIIFDSAVSDKFHAHTLCMWVKRLSKLHHLVYVQAIALILENLAMSRAQRGKVSLWWSCFLTNDFLGVKFRWKRVSERDVSGHWSVIPLVGKGSLDSIDDYIRHVGYYRAAWELPESGTRVAPNWTARKVARSVPTPSYQVGVSFALFGKNVLQVSLLKHPWMRGLVSLPLALDEMPRVMLAKDLTVVVLSVALYSHVQLTWIFCWFIYEQVSLECG